MAATDLPLAELLKKTPEQIVEWFQAKGYAVSWSWRDVWKEAHAEAFTVAKATQLEVLADLKEGVRRILEDGVPKERWMAEMEARMKARGWWGQKLVTNPATGQLERVQLGSPHRLETIYRTNAQVAFQRGRYREQRRQEKFRPFWQYVAVMDSRTRRAHAALNGRCFPAASKAWDTIYPPNGFNCRCRVRALTPAEVARKGIQVETEYSPTPGFPDEGWDYNAAAGLPPPGTAPLPSPAAIPQELEGWPITTQEAHLLEGLEQARAEAQAAGIDPDAVARVGAILGAYASIGSKPFDPAKLEGDAADDEEEEP